MSASSEAPDPTYTVIIRCPFPRGDFVDPPPVEWDATKDKALWKVLSNAAKNSDIDWHELAQRLDVTLPFLFQQTAWLYERQMSQVRAQMRKVGASKAGSGTTSGTESVGGETMKRQTSGGSGKVYVAKIESQLTRTGPRMSDHAGKRDVSVAGVPRANAPPLIRNISGGTVRANQIRQFPQTSPGLTKATLAANSPSQSKMTASSPVASSSDESDSDIPVRSRIMRRPPRFDSRSMGNKDENDGPALLPFSATADQDPSATLKIAEHAGRKHPVSRIDGAQESQTSDSSASSAAPIRLDKGKRPLGPLSPRRTAELSGRSPVSRVGKEGSDDSPSMGSSFSDLDDASVTQSALEEALASKMQGGGMASRMSTFSNALKSRYLESNRRA